MNNDFLYSIKVCILKVKKKVRNFGIYDKEKVSDTFVSNKPNSSAENKCAHVPLSGNLV